MTLKDFIYIVFRLLNMNTFSLEAYEISTPQ